MTAPGAVLVDDLRAIADKVWPEPDVDGRRQVQMYDVREARRLLLAAASALEARERVVEAAVAVKEVRKRHTKSAAIGQRGLRLDEQWDNWRESHNAIIRELHARLDDLETALRAALGTVGGDMT